MRILRFYLAFAPIAARAAIATTVLLLLLVLLPSVADAAEPVPPWQGLDIGAVGVAGDDTESSGVVTISASGADIWGTNDAFRFFSQERHGDGAVVARVTSRGTGNSWAKVGVMYREDLGADAREVMLYVTPGNAFGLQYRSAVGGATTAIDLGRLEGTTWLMIIRQGNTFRGYRSPDGNYWTAAGNIDVPMAADAYAGLAVSSHDNAALLTATFDNALQFDGAPPPLTPPNPPANFTGNAVSMTMIRLYWDTVVGASAYELERATAPSGPFTQIAVLAADASTYADQGLTPGTQYYYRIRTRRDSQTSRFSGYVSPRYEYYLKTYSTLPPGEVRYFSGYGTATVTDGTVTMDNDGEGITAEFNRFMIYGWTLVGDVDLRVRIAGLSAASPLAQAGLMIRGTELYSSGDLAGTIVVTPGGTSSFISRAVVAGENQVVAGPAVAIPSWVRITRAGDVVTGYVSPDGLNWTLVGSRTIVFGSDVFVGCVTSSHSAQENATATYDQFSPPLASRPFSPTTLRVTMESSAGVRLAWEDNSDDETGFDIGRRLTNTGSNLEMIASVAAGVTTFEDNDVVPNGYYTYSVRSRRNDRPSAWSATVSAHVPPSAGLEAPTDLRLTGLSQTSISMAWNDHSSNETGFEIERFNGNSWRLHATVGANVTSFTDTGLMAGSGYYYYRVRAAGSVSGSGSDYTHSLYARTEPPARSIWSATAFQYAYGWEEDVGDSIVLHAPGGDLWDKFDQGAIYYRPWHGDGSITVRVASLANTHPWAKAGVMIRQNMDAGAANAAMLITAGNVAGFQTRPAAGEATEFVSGPTTSLPGWVRLTRVGNVFTGFVSSDGSHWTLVGSKTVVLSADVTIGLVASAHSADGTLTTATFDHLDLPADSQAPVAPDHLRVGGSSSTSITLAWDDLSTNETAFELVRSIGNGGTMTLLATLPAGSQSYTDTGLSANTTYSYRVRALNGTLASYYSNLAMATPSTPAPGVPATPTDLRADLRAATSIRMAWTDQSSDETGFEIGRRVHDTGEFVSLATLGANVTTYVDSGLTPDTVYDYHVRTVRDGVYSAYLQTAVSTTSADAGTWAGGDIGAVGPTGSGVVSSDGSTYTLQAGGGDIEGTADACRFHYVQWHGDGSVTARVASLTNTNPWAKAGVMIRESFAANAANATMVLTAGNVCGFQTRNATGAGTEFTSGAWINPAYWVRLTRVGNVFSGFVSPDGVTWTQVGSRTIAMSADVFMGLAASAHSSSGALTTAVFDHVTVPASSTPPASDWAQMSWGGTTGSKTVTASTVSVTATGGDIWGTSDSGFFALRDWTGNATIMARLTQFTPADGWTKAGLMIRPAAGDAQAVNAFVAFAGVGRVFQARTAAAAQTSSSQPNGTTSAGQWLKLVRSGNTFTGYYSADNRVTWTPLGSATITMPSTIQVGVALSSHNNTTASTAAFADFTVE
ncbi:MAG TPA: fibronectin type III domain-containing protein [Lacunisphaera sp.]|nr:fibronectin type III domain-containing protein [Lacunisphaera sp.]